MLSTLFLLAVVLVVQPSFSQGISAPSVAGFDPARLARIDTAFQRLIDQKVLPGAVAMIVRNGQVVYLKAHGTSNIDTGEPLRTDHIFRIASQTKAITSVAIMMLMEEGHFTLETPVSTFIPSFKNPQVLVEFNEKTMAARTRPAKREITIRDLLSHTSGILYGHPLYTQQGIPDWYSTAPITIAEKMDALGRLPLSHDPGERFTYGLNTDVLGRVVEVVSGLSLAEFFQRRIFAPLGMKDTYFFLPEDRAARLVKLHSRPADTGVLSTHAPDPSRDHFPITGARTYFSGGAGLSGTIADYARFLQMLLNGGELDGVRLLSPKTIALMLTNQIGDSKIWNRPNKFGLGFELMTEAGLGLEMGTPGLYKWGGAFGSDYWVDPAEQMICLLMQNVLPRSGPDAQKIFRTMVYQALTEPNVR